MLVKDARGRVLTLSQAPVRLVSLVPSITEMLFAYGVGERVVGITDYCVYPAEGVAIKPRIGGTKNPRIEQIVALHPDLVIANKEENRRPDVERLEAAGIPVFVTFAQTVRAAIGEMRDIAALVGSDRAAPIVDGIEQTLAQCESKPPGRRPRVFCPIWRDPWMTANGETFIGDLIRTCGGDNVFETRERRFPLAADLASRESVSVEGRDTRYPRISLEEIVAAGPEIILLPDEPYAFTAQDASDLRGVAGLRDAHIHLIDGTLISWYGVRMGTALKMLYNLFRAEEAV